MKTSSLTLLLLFLALLVGVESWSHHPYWPDAGGYAASVEQGKWVAHPPGYVFFVVAGRLVHLFTANSYLAVQIVSFAGWLLSIPLMHYGLLRLTTRNVACALTACFAFSWIPLVISHTGASHSVDLLLVTALLVIVTSPRFSSDGAPWYFWGMLCIIAGFRLTTLIMLAPLAVRVLWNFRASRAHWMSVVFTTAFVIGLYFLTIRLSGGWEAYSGYAKSLASGARPSSLLLNGFTKPALLNAFRSLFWFMSALGGVFMVAAFRSPKRLTERTSLDLLISFLGPLGLTTFYLATHPGYLAPALPGVVFLAAWICGREPAPRSTWILLAIGLTISLVWYFGGRIIRQPQGKWQAAANGLVLQYSRDGVRTSTFKTLSGWLIEAGESDVVPQERLDTLREEALRNK